MKNIIKKSNNNNSYYLIGILVLSAILLFALLPHKQPIDKNPQATQTQPTPSIKTYHSESLGITFDYPVEFEVEEKNNRILLKNKEVNTIQIFKITTNIDNVNIYLDKLAVMNHLTIINKFELSIGHYETVLVNFIGSERTYFISPKKELIFSFSTDEKSLYNDLDQIAQSFRYDP